MRFRLLISAWFCTLMAASFGASTAQGEELLAYLRENDSPRSVDIDFSPCAGEEVSECAYYHLTCDPAQHPPIQLQIIAGPVLPIVTKLIKAEDGVAGAQFTLSAGATKISLPISTIQIASNEMDGAWMATFSFYEDGPLLDALTVRSAEGATVSVGGKSMALAPQRGDGVKLVRWRDICRTPPVSAVLMGPTEGCKS